MNTKHSIITIGISLAAFIFAGELLPGFSEGVQKFISHTTGILVIGANFLAAYCSLKIGDKLNIVAKWKKIVVQVLSPIALCCMSIMYMLWLSINFGELRPYISEIGFNLPQASMSLIIFTFTLIIDELLDKIK